MTANPINFHTLNKFGQFVPFDNFEMVHEFLKCVENIKKHFQFPCFYNGLLLHYILLDTKNSLWHGERYLLENTKHLELAQDVIMAIMQKEELTCCKVMPILCDTLAQMFCFSFMNMVSSIEPKSSLSGSVMEAEWKWFHWCIDMFQHVYDTIAPDFSSVQKQIAVVRNADFSYTEELNLESKNMFHIRFQAILDHLTQIRVSRKVRLTVAAKNYKNALLINLGRFNSLGSLKAQIQHYVGNLVPVIGIDQVLPADAIDQILGPTGFVDVEKAYMIKYRIKKMASFLKNRDHYISVMLLTLLKDTQDQQVEKLHHKLTDLLLARLKKCTEYKDVDPVSILSEFCNDLEAFGNLMETYFR